MSGTEESREPQWRATLREDDGNTIVSFTFEGERGHVQMDAPAGDLDLGGLDVAQAAALRRKAQSCIISWKDDAGHTRTVIARVVGASSIQFSTPKGRPLGRAKSYHKPIGDQDPGSLKEDARGVWADD